MALQVTNQIESTASDQTVAQAKFIADESFKTAHSTTDNKQNTINEFLYNKADNAAPSAYIKSASVQNNTLTLTDKNGTNVSFTKNDGTVTSVGLSMPATVFTVTGSPVTGSGTITSTLKQQNSNAIFAGPESGSGAVPSFRYLVPEDIPELDYLEDSDITGSYITQKLGYTPYNSSNPNGYTSNTGTITKVGNVSSGTVVVSSNNNTAQYGQTVTVGTVGGVNLTFKMPAEPEDVKVQSNFTSVSESLPILLNHNANEGDNTVLMSENVTVNPAVGQVNMRMLNDINIDFLQTCHLVFYGYDNQIQYNANFLIV